MQKRHPTSNHIMSEYFLSQSVQHLSNSLAWTPDCMIKQDPYTWKNVTETNILR